MSHEVWYAYSVYPWGEWFTSAENPRAEVPFGRQSFIVGNDDGFYFGDNATYQILRYRFDGTVERFIRKVHAPVPVPDQAVREWKRQLLDAIADANTRARIARMVEPVEGPPTMPAYSQLLVDPVGSLWVREYQPAGEGSSRWTVFDQNGVMRGEVMMPEGFVAYQVGRDFVLGRWRDEMDVEHVQLYRLVKP